jgi:hypothetical protein
MLRSTNFNANTVMLAVVLLLGLLLAIIVGDSVASGRYAYVGLVALAFLGVPLGLKLGTNFWILIVLTIAADGRLGFVPIPFNLSEIGTMAAALLFALHVVLRRIEVKVPLRLVDTLIFINVAWLVVTFIKNPTGLHFLGSDSVGARKYVVMGFAFVGYFILSRCRIPATWAYRLPIWLAVGLAVPYSLQTVATLSPELGRAITQVYGVETISDARLLSQGAMGSEERVLGLEKTAVPFFLAMCAYYPPVSFINPLYPLRFLGFAVTFVLVGLSGFRSSLLIMGGYMAIGTWLRGRVRDFIPLAAVGAFGLLALAGAVQSGVPVPLTVQRALSILPLGWDSSAVEDAEGTTTWRLDMWRDAWNDPNYFKDKVFGDGFGFTQQELMLFANQMQGFQSLVGGASYEMFIVRGSLHNGPLSSIRYGGFVGLVLLTVLMFCTAMYAVKVVSASTGTVYLPIAFFTAIPLIYELFAFFLVIGAYDNQMAQFFLGAGMLNLINRSLPHPVGATSQSRKQTIPTPAAIPSSGIPVPAARLR